MNYDRKTLILTSPSQTWAKNPKPDEAQRPVPVSALNKANLQEPYDVLGKALGRDDVTLDAVKVEPPEQGLVPVQLLGRPWDGKEVSVHLTKSLDIRIGTQALTLIDSRSHPGACTIKLSGFLKEVETLQKNFLLNHFLNNRGIFPFLRKIVII